MIWSAPSIVVDSCVRLCARASHAEGTKTSILARKICPAPTGTANFSRQPPIIEPCCACDEAKYEVSETFWPLSLSAELKWKIIFQYISC